MGAPVPIYTGDLDDDIQIVIRQGGKSFTIRLGDLKTFINPT